MLIVEPAGYYGRKPERAEPAHVNDVVRMAQSSQSPEDGNDTHPAIGSSAHTVHVVTVSPLVRGEIGSGPQRYDVGRYPSARESFGQDRALTLPSPNDGGRAFLNQAETHTFFQYSEHRRPVLGRRGGLFARWLLHDYWF